MWQSFITGSRVYGYVRDDSDIDLVIACDSFTYALLWSLSDVKGKLVFGKLNLVAFNIDSQFQRERFEKWKSINFTLIDKKPVTKEEAILAFRNGGAEMQYVKPPENIVI